MDINAQLYAAAGSLMIRQYPLQMKLDGLQKCLEAVIKIFLFLPGIEILSSILQALSSPDVQIHVVDSCLNAQNPSLNSTFCRQMPLGYSLNLFLYGTSADACFLQHRM
jgi:hypothetical protein